MGNVDSFLSKFGGGQGEEVLEAPSMLSTSAPNALGAFLDKFSTLTESYWFYQNSEQPIELRFDKDDHKYYKVDPELGNLIEQRGVTNTCHIVDRSQALVPWASKKCAEKILRTIPLSPTPSEFNELMLAPITLTDFTKLVMEAKNAHKEILIEAGDIGHLAHKCLEDSIQHAIDHTDGIVRELRNIPEDEKAKAAAEAGFNWMQAHNVRWRKTEQKIYSREHEYAGTMDGLAVCDSCDDPTCCAKPFRDHLSLIDWKSSNYLYIEYCAQTASYVHAEEEEYEVKIDDRWILRLGKNEDEAGKFQPWYLDGSTQAEDFTFFLTCLNLTKLVDSVNERMQIQKKGVRAAKKKQKAEQKEIAKMKAKVEKEAERAAKKIERTAERERIKTEAKRNREEAKRLSKLAVGTGKELATSTASEAIEVRSVKDRNESVERPSPVAPTPIAETTESKLTEAIMQARADCRLEGLPVPAILEMRRALEETVKQGNFEEESSERRPLVIPEEG